MNLLKYAVGVDISKEKFHACMTEINLEQRIKIKSSRAFDNTPKGFETFRFWVEKHRKEALEVFYTMEATGVYYEQLAWFLHMNNSKVSVILPNKGKMYLKSKVGREGLEPSAR